MFTLRNALVLGLCVIALIKHLEKARNCRNTGLFEEMGPVVQTQALFDRKTGNFLGLKFLPQNFSKK